MAHEMDINIICHPQNLKQENLMSVVDAWNFCPVSIIEIERLAETKNNTPLKENEKSR